MRAIFGLRMIEVCYNINMPIRSTPSSFWKKAKRATNGCLEWTKCLHKDGYGQLGYHNQYWLAHRLAWTLRYGEIPQGMCVCHKCDNPLCIDPDHLFLGTQQENMADMKHKGRRKNVNTGTENGRAIINQEIANEIRAKYDLGSIKQVDLAKRYGVSQPLISMIIRNKHWA